jgi:hypothetical protein
MGACLTAPFFLAVRLVIAGMDVRDGRGRNAWPLLLLEEPAIESDGGGGATEGMLGEKRLTKGALLSTSGCAGFASRFASGFAFGFAFAIASASVLDACSSPSFAAFSSAGGSEV